MQQFKDAKIDEKDARFGAYHGQFCLYVNNKRIPPPSTAWELFENVKSFFRVTLTLHATTNVSCAAMRSEVIMN